METFGNYFQKFIFTMYIFIKMKNLIVIITAFLLTACNSNVQKKQTKAVKLKEENHAMGISFSYKEFQVNVANKTVITSNTSFYRESWQKIGCNYLRVVLQIKNISSTPATFSNGAIVMHNQQGDYLYEGFELNSPSYPGLSGDTNPLISRTGVVFFEMPQDVSGNISMIFLDDTTRHSINLGQYN